MKNGKKIANFKEIEARREKAVAKETLLMYKFLYVTLVALIGIIGVLVIRNNGMATVNFLVNVQMPLTIVFAVLTVLALIGFVICRRKNTDEQSRVVTSTSLLAIAFIALVLTFSYKYVDVYYDTWRIIALIVIAALYFVYHIYDSLFFAMSVQCALGVLAVNLLAKTSLPMAFRVVIGVVTIILCTVGAYLLLSKEDKKAAIKDYKFIIMTAVLIACTLLSLFVPAIISYAIFALLAVYIVISVISTIELM